MGGESCGTLTSGHGMTVALLKSQLLLVPAQDETCEQPMGKGKELMGPCSEDLYAING